MMAPEIGRIGTWTPSSIWENAGDRDEAIAELEELGFGAVWLGSPRGDLELPGALLGASGRLAVVPAIVNIWKYPATDVAAAYHGIEPQGRERLLVGLGSSHRPQVEAAGIRYDKPVTRLEQYLDDLDALPETISPGDRILAALGPRALRLAAARSAGAHPYLVTPEHTRAAREIVGPDALLAPEQKVVVETDPATARAKARPTLDIYLSLPNYTNNLRRLGFTDADFVEGGSDRLVDAIVAWGDPGQILTRVAEHHAAGADHVSIQVLTGGQRTGKPLPREEWRAIGEALETVGSPS